MLNWSGMTTEQKLDVCRRYPGQQAHVSRLTGTTSSAVGGFMSRHAIELGLNRKPIPSKRPAVKNKHQKPKDGYWSESNLTEKWHDRYKAREQAGTVYVSKKTGRPGNRWTPEMKADFTAMYNRGIALDKIARKLGVGENACKKQRISLKLKPRRPRRAANRIQIHLQLDPEEYLLVRDGAERRGSSMVDYIAFLINRDGGKVL